MTHRDREAIRSLRQLICLLLCEQEPPRVGFDLTLAPYQLHFVGDFNMQLPDDKTVSATVSYTDAKGKPAKVDGVPVWASDNEAVATVVASADGMSATVTPVDLGTAQITVTADADVGAGIEELIAMGTVEIIAGKAVAGVVNFGEPA